MVSGDADYKEVNIIGFCDLCGSSVHRECFGLLIFNATTDFVCFSCRAFGTDLSKQSVCLLCGQLNAAQIPTTSLKNDKKLLGRQVKMSLSQMLKDEEVLKGPI